MANEYIKRESAINKLLQCADDYDPDYSDITVAHAMNKIKEIPAADVRPMVHAKITADGACSACGSYMPTDTRRDAIFDDEVHFCYYCGAVIDEDKKEIILPSLVIGGKHYEGYLPKACDTTNEAAMREVDDG